MKEFFRVLSVLLTLQFIVPPGAVIAANAKAEGELADSHASAAASPMVNEQMNSLLFALGQDAGSIIVADRTRKTAWDLYKFGSDAKPGEVREYLLKRRVPD